MLREALVSSLIPFVISQGIGRDLGWQCHTRLSRMTMEESTSMSNKIRTELGHVRMEVGAKFEPIVAAVAQAESAIQRLQEGFSEMVAMMQILQATSYNGVFV